MLSRTTLCASLCSADDRASLSPRQSAHALCWTRPSAPSASAASRTCRCASSPVTSASATAPRAATFPIARRCSTRWPRPALTGSAPSCAPRSTRAGDDFEARLRATAAAYIRFATADPALLELMFAVKHREQAGALQEAAERAFSVMLEVILQGQAEGRLEPGDPSASGSSCSRPSRGSPRCSPGAWWRPSSSTSCSTIRSRTSSAGRGPRSRARAGPRSADGRCGS